MTDMEILVDKGEDEGGYDFTWRLESEGEDWKEFNGNAAYEEMKMGKWTDINPHLLYRNETLSDFEEKIIVYRPCKDPFINYLGF